ncbi:MAG: hypothetical protein ACXAEI_01785 [Candidatus Hodarchaeales archaeon]|jgi:hypothetical protein
MKKQLNLFLIVLLVFTYASASTQAVELEPHSKLIPNSPIQSEVTRVLVDKSQITASGEFWIPDGFSIFASYLKDFNYTVETNVNKTIVYDAASLDPATQIDLKDYHILILAFPAEDLAAAYISDIMAFVNDGGGLLLGGVAPSKQMWHQSPLFLNPLSQNFGVEFNYYPVGGISRVLPQSRDGTVTGEFLSHPIWNGVSSINFEGCALNITGTQANTIAIHNATAPIGNTTAVAEHGAGRVLFTGSYHNPFGSLYDSSLLNPATDHYQFVLNAMNWLAERPHQTAAYQYPYKTYLRDGPDLTQDELNDYNLYVGSIHVHVSNDRGGHDDGRSSPDEQIDTAEAIDLDYIIQSSHTYGRDLVSDWTTIEAGGFYMKEKAKRENYHVVCHVGSEVSGSWAHIMVFPYTKDDEGKTPRIDTPEHFAEDVAALRAQHDLFVGWSHPELTYDASVPPPEILEKIESGELPIDTLELRYSTLSLFLQYKYPFYAPSDAHSSSALNYSLTYLFAESRSDADLIDALRDRRAVALNVWSHSFINDDPYQLTGRYAGDRVWVDEFFRRIEVARTTLTTVQAEIDAKAAEGDDVSEATAKLNLAWRAFNQLSPGKAQSLADKVFAEASKDSPGWSFWLVLLSFHFLVWIHVRRARKRRI